MTHTSPFPILLGLALAGVLACDRPPPGAITRCQAVTVIPEVARTDILFVVDDSNSMTEEQQNLADNFDAFIAKLESSPFKNDFQIGITSTSVDLQYRDPSSGTSRVVTAFQRGPNTGKPYPAGALIAVDPSTGAYLPDGPRVLLAGSPTLVQDFRNNVKVGTFGSGKEQGLLAARLALTDRVADGTNAGFLRPGARLAVVIVSDADDCSDPEHQLSLDTTSESCYGAAAKALITPVSDLVQALRGSLGGERRDVVAAVIAGVDPVTKAPAVTCVGPEDKADRYKTFVDSFGDSGLIDDICSSSFRSTLEAIAGLIEPPQSVTVEPAPDDPRMLSVHIDRAGVRVPCPLALPGDPSPEAASAIYVPPEVDQPARIRFQNTCILDKGDRVTVQLLCAG